MANPFIFYDPPGIDNESIKRARRREYKSLDEFAKAEGVKAVLDFLAYQSSVVGGYYRHSQMPVLPFTVNKWPG